ncbi:MAG: DUF2194 domain-containing protein [Lachnospiraceae bacterium]|nr:DUF2194 domain-containing protein [Lachnospiraceae bacterium]
MVSKRKFFVIFLMMAILLFLFQSAQIMRENWNYYSNNEYASDLRASADSAWTEERLAGLRKSAVRGIFFVGEQESKRGQVVAQWCTYKKYKLTTQSSLARFSSVTDIPTMVVIDGMEVEPDKYLTHIDSYLRAGVPVFFATLPEVKAIKDNPKLQELLGISDIPKESVKVDGVRLFGGYLLGGEAISWRSSEGGGADDPMFLMPWYVTGVGSKTYMTGLMNDAVYQGDELPRIFWRNSSQGGMVFAVNGSYMEDETGYGFLDIGLYEISDYVIYPVVNAQNTLLVDFPDFSGADEEIVTRLYSRDAQSIQQDIFWPSIYSMITKFRLKPTCFFMTQYTFSEEPKVRNGQVDFYLQQLNEVGAEAGRSLRYGEDMTLGEKFAADVAFYDRTGCMYDFRAAYLDDVDEKTLHAAGDMMAQEGINTLAAETETKDMLAYLADDVSLQGITHKAQEYSFREALRIRGILDSVGYSNMLVDFHPVLWPQSREDSWEIYFDKVYSNIYEGWSTLSFYEQTTLSQSDARVRSFLSVDYVSIRNDDVLYLYLRDGAKEGYFLLRTHDEQITGIEDGTYQKLEEDAWLIHAQDNIVRISLEDSGEILRYEGPFGLERLGK